MANSYGPMNDCRVVYDSFDIPSNTTCDGPDGLRMAESQGIMPQGNIGFYYGFYDVSGSPEIMYPTSPLFSPDFSPMRTSTQILSMKDVSLERVNRRRESNRLSQRAYRDRKESLRRELEGQVAVWKAKHGELAKSHSAQNDEITRLKTEIAKLMTHLESLRSDQAFDLAPVRVEDEDESASIHVATCVEDNKCHF